jgi:tetratricopeptide (TPR) repeat protein
MRTPDPTPSAIPMSASSRRPTATEHVLLLVFAALGAGLLYLAAMQDKGWECWVVGTALLLSGGVMVVPEWRDPFGRGLSRIRVDFTRGTLGLGGTSGSSLPDQVEKPSEAVLPPRAKVPRALASASDQLVAGLKNVDDPLTYWAVFIGLVENEDYGSARAVIEAALERFPRHPKLLISAGYMWARLKDVSKAIELARQAVEIARGQEEHREQFYVAHANLCYYLAGRGEARDRAEALAAGKLASDHADEFTSRHSFKINYGFAQVQFAAARAELADAIVFLARMVTEPLTRADRDEVDQYLQQGVQKLKEMP